MKQTILKRNTNSVIYCIISLVFTCCNSNNEIQRRFENGVTIEGNFVGDSMIHGFAKHYDILGNLVAEYNYDSGVLSGNARRYYDSEDLYDEAYYIHGERHGVHKVYSREGNISYMDYYHFGRILGPVLYYDGDSITEYGFLAFDGSRIMEVNYNEFGEERMNCDFRKLIGVREVRVDSVLFVEFFVYTPFPPRFRMSYKVSVLSKKSIEEVYNFKESEESVYRIVRIRDRGDSIRYELEMNLYDSITKKSESIVTEVSLSN